MYLCLLIYCALIKVEFAPFSSLHFFLFRKISHLNKWFEENGYNKEKIWADIEDVIIKTLIVSHPTLKHNYRTCFPNHNRGSACFEILGFDIMLDRKLKPWLIEVYRDHFCFKSILIELKYRF